MKKILAALLVAILAMSMFCAFAETYSFTFLTTQKENGDVDSAIASKYSNATCVVDTDAMTITTRFPDQNVVEPIIDYSETDSGSIAITTTRADGSSLLYLISPGSDSLLLLTMDGDSYIFYAYVG